MLSIMWQKKTKSHKRPLKLLQKFVFVIAYTKYVSRNSWINFYIVKIYEFTVFFFFF